MLSGDVLLYFRLKTHQAVMPHSPLAQVPSRSAALSPPLDLLSVYVTKQQKKG